MKPLKERIAIEQAFLDGIDVEIDVGSTTDFIGDLGAWNPDDYIFNWMNNDYRMKPKPMEFWVNVCPSYISQGYSTKDAAGKNRGVDVVRVIKVREITE